jgi:hypothetical protein
MKSTELINEVQLLISMFIMENYSKTLLLAVKIFPAYLFMIVRHRGRLYYFVSFQIMNCINFYFIH